MVKGVRGGLDVRDALQEMKNNLMLCSITHLSFVWQSSTEGEGGEEAEEKEFRWRDQG